MTFRAGRTEVRIAVLDAVRSRTRLEVKMANNGGRQINQDLLPPHLVRANVAAHDSADAVEPAVLVPVDKGRLQLADEHIFIVGQGAPGLSRRL